MPAKTVFARCMTICEKFSKQEYDRCMEWMNWRNEELHTGSMPFENLKTGNWLPDFYRICSIFLENNNSNLDDFVGTMHATQATMMVEALSQEEKKKAYGAVKEQRRIFEDLEVAERLERIRAGSEKSKQYVKENVGSKEIECPSCEGRAVIIGELIRSTTPKEEAGELIQEDVWLPRGLGCLCCRLRISGHAQVAALGFGDQFVSKDYLDPKDYFDIEFDPADYFEDEYGND